MKTAVGYAFKPRSGKWMYDGNFQFPDDVDIQRLIYCADRSYLVSFNQGRGPGMSGDDPSLTYVLVPAADWGWPVMYPATQ